MSHTATLITDSGLCVFFDNDQFTVPNDHPNFSKILELIKAKKFSQIKPLIDVRSSVSKWISKDKDFKLENDMISLDGEPFADAVTEKVLSMMEVGSDPEPLFRFLRKVRKNTSRVAQSELLLFCVANNFMIHEDGDILAYKGVRSDFKDIHSGTIDNSVGKVISMVRSKVDDDRNRTCSAGLHFASFEYASTWSGSIGHVMVMKINPADVVSIPSDYSNQKGRCAKYEVIAELSSKNTPLTRKEVYSDKDAGVVGGKTFNEKEIARKQAILDRWTEELERRKRRGLSRSAIWTLEDAIDQIEDEIEDLKERGSRSQVVEDDFDDEDEDAGCDCDYCRGYDDDDLPF